VKLRALLKSDAPLERLEAAINSLARSIARMHTSSIMHRDLTSGNFLVAESGQVYLVDLNRAKSVRRMTRRRRLLDLARINLTSHAPELTERLVKMFFLTYCVESDLTTDLEREYWTYRGRRLRRLRLRRRLRRILRRK
jgi:tRNA A-37 threonylcarbamoyl transferase component Bud32